MEAVYVHDLDVIRHDGVLVLVERTATIVLNQKEADCAKFKIPVRDRRSEEPLHSPP